MLAVTRALLSIGLPLAVGLPPFSWNTVPTYIHCANITGQWNAKAVARMARSISI